MNHVKLVAAITNLTSIAGFWNLGHVYDQSRRVKSTERTKSIFWEVVSCRVIKRSLLFPQNDR
jgi:uncharacterized membrane protein YdfJ with MMPL/SSD domain